MVNTFEQDLDYSKKHSKERDNILYSVFFPVEIIDVTDKKTQLSGIDKILVLAGGRRITIEEKERRRDYGDFLIEGFSTFVGNHDSRNKSGWIEKEGSDWLFYYIEPTKSGYLLPFKLLQSTWRKHRKEWYLNGTIIEKLKTERNGRVCMNFAIEIPTLLEAMKNEAISINYSGVYWTFV